MWLLIETNTSKSEPLTEYWLSSFSNILILKNAIYSFVLGLWGVTYSVKVFESCSSKFGLSSSCCFELPCPISFFGPRTLAHSVCWSSWKGGGEEKMERSIITNRKAQKFINKVWEILNLRSIIFSIFGHLWADKLLASSFTWPCLTLPDHELDHGE